MAMHVVSVERKKPVYRSVDMGREPILDSFAHHGALFARNGEHVVVFLRRNGFAKRHIEVLQRPVRMAALHVAQLKVIDP